jgi:tetratricopeptide (TPR) repeat protein
MFMRITPHLREGLRRLFSWAVRGSLAEVVSKVIVGLVVATAAGLGLVGQYDLLEWWQRQWFTPGSGQQLTVLVASLADDPDRSQTRHVIQSLEDQLETGQGAAPLRVRRYPATLDVSGKSDLADELLRAQEKGRLWLAKANADLLIWGDVAARDRTLRLRFLTRAGEAQMRAKPFNLTEVLELPPNFDAEFGVALAALAAASVEPAGEGGNYIADVLGPALKRLAPLVEHPPVGMSADLIAHLRSAYALASDRVGEQNGDIGAFKAARVSYQQILATWNRQTRPLEWARTQNNLGIVLWHLGERDGGVLALLEAAEAYRAALEEITRQRAPLDWARIQNNLAIVLGDLGDRQDDTAKLQEAADAYRASFQEFTRERMPLNWARAHTNLGIVLQGIGEREDGTAKLQEAVEAYRVALEVLTRERVPLDWARTKDGLAYALSFIGDRTRRLEPLEEGAAACRAALEVQTRERLPVDFAATQDTYAKILLHIAEQRGDIGEARESRERATVASEVFTQARSTHSAEIARKRLAQIDDLIEKLSTSPVTGALKQAP